MIQVRGVATQFGSAAERELTQRPEALDRRLFVFRHWSPHCLETGCSSSDNGHCGRCEAMPAKNVPISAPESAPISGDRGRTSHIPTSVDRVPSAAALGDGWTRPARVEAWRRKSNSHIQKARGAGDFASIHSTFRRARTPSRAPEMSRKCAESCASLRAAPTVKSVSSTVASLQQDVGET